MTLKEYTACCLKFAHDSTDWYHLDPYKFYTTESANGWKESCDNAHDGINVEWAFHCSDEEIKSNASKYFLDELLTSLEQAAAEEWELEQWHTIATKFEH